MAEGLDQPLCSHGAALIAAPLFHGSFIVEDGRVSIRRSFRPHELRRLAPPSWDVFPVFPFRQAMVYRAAKGK